MPNPPKPLEIRALEGNRGKRPMPKAIALKDASNHIPDELAGYAREWFKLVSSELRTPKILKTIDVPGLAIVAQVYANMRMAQDSINKNGVETVGSDGVVHSNPMVSEFRLSAKLYHEMGSAFGLSPVSRTRFAIAATKTKEKDPGEERLKQLLG